MISHAEEVEVRLKKTWHRRRIASVAYLAITVTYLLWRLTVFVPQAWLLSFFFYLAAVFDFILGATLVFISWNHVRRTSPPVTRTYTVDVLVPVYTEPIEMIEFTITAAKEIDFPHETYVLDDGRREEIREAARKLGIHYLSRPDNKGAKAGNLNFGMEHSRGELIAVFDADHIAQRESIGKMIGFLDDPEVAMVQAPQTFYNEDAFVYRDVVVGGMRWEEQSIFHDVAQPCRDAYNGASGVGTGALYRRSALEAIGGFPTLTLTEDFHTSLLFQKSGWKVPYLNEPVAWGVAAADVPEYTKTRHRWAHGNLHVAAHENILFCKGLTFMQRLSYLSVVINYIEGWQQLLYILIPAYVMFFYITPMTPGLFNIAMVLLVPAVQVILGLIIGAGFVRFIPGQIFGIGRMHLCIAGTAGLFGGKMRWRVSRKNVLGNVSLALLLPQIFVGVTGFGAVIYALIREFGLMSQKAPSRSVDYMVFMACAFIFFNTLRSVYWVWKTISQAGQTHQEYMFEVPVPVCDEHHRPLGQVTHLSTTEARPVWLNGETSLAGRVVRFLIPGHSVAARIEEMRPDGSFSFTCVDAEGLNRLKRSLYSVDWHMQIRVAPVCHRTRMENLAGPWYSAVVRRDKVDNSAFWAVIQPAGSAHTRVKLMTGESIEPGENLTIEWAQNEQSRQDRRIVSGLCSTKYRIPKDLNDRTYHIFDLDPVSDLTKIAAIN